MPVLPVMAHRVDDGKNLWPRDPEKMVPALLPILKNARRPAAATDRPGDNPARIPNGRLTVCRRAQGFQNFQAGRVRQHLKHLRL